MDAKLDALQRALRGEEFVYEGRKVKVTPPALTPGGPRLAYGGHSLAAARRAGRCGLDMFAEGDTPNLLEDVSTSGPRRRPRTGQRTDPRSQAHPRACSSPKISTTRGTRSARTCCTTPTLPRVDGRQHGRRESIRVAPVAQMRAENGAYRILTPDQAIAQVKSGVPLLLHPLCGGCPPEYAWESLRLVGEYVMPALK
jgi:alkanesulfonate monooxygenase SsuD/methylene tetrahydromethanopterin reductase-like flavin-dependent oxidoreductase (luciferase family)